LQTCLTATGTPFHMGYHTVLAVTRLQRWHSCLYPSQPGWYSI